jgi:hypothetical protein
VLGKFKDAANSVPVTHYEGLRAKLAMKYVVKVTKTAMGMKMGKNEQFVTFDNSNDIFFLKSISDTLKAVFLGTQKLNKL